jgi:hypothetical protein
MTARGLYRTNTALSDAQIVRNDTKRQRKLIGLTRKFSQQKLKKKNRVPTTSLRHGLPTSRCCHVYVSQQNRNFQHFYIIFIAAVYKQPRTNMASQFTGGR